MIQKILNMIPLTIKPVKTKNPLFTKFSYYFNKKMCYNKEKHKTERPQL